MHRSARRHRVGVRGGCHGRILLLTHFGWNRECGRRVFKGKLDKQQACHAFGHYLVNRSAVSNGEGRIMEMG